MKCSICGRTLRDPKSMELGYGPVCYRRKFGFSPRLRRQSKDTSSDSWMLNYNIPGQITIDEYLQTT